MTVERFLDLGALTSIGVIGVYALVRFFTVWLFTVWRYFKDRRTGLLLIALCLVATSAHAFTPQQTIAQCARQLNPPGCASCNGNWMPVAHCAAQTLYPRVPMQIFYQCAGEVTRAAANQPMSYDRPLATLQCVANKGAR